MAGNEAYSIKLTSYVQIKTMSGPKITESVIAQHEVGQKIIFITINFTNKN